VISASALPKDLTEAKIEATNRFNQRDGHYKAGRWYQIDLEQ
jgi:hypothetical protein